MRTSPARHPRFLLTPLQMSSSNTEHGTLSFAILTPATQPSSQNKDSVQFRFLSPNLSTVSCPQYPVYLATCKMSIDENNDSGFFLGGGGRGR